MERGLLWLPLLGVFIWLAWAGWNEYRKLEAYKVWAADFERAKYDIYAALGQRGDQLTWGQPTRQGVQQPQQLSLNAATAIALCEDGDLPARSSTIPRGCRVCLKVSLATGAAQWIPFTDAELASRWQEVLQSDLEPLESTPQTQN